MPWNEERESSSFFSNMLTLGSGEEVCWRTKVTALPLRPLDTLASRSAPPTIVCDLMDACELPFAADGTVPDLILSPARWMEDDEVHAVHESMELLFGWLGLFAGARVNGSSFQQKPPLRSVLSQSLVLAGFHASGKQWMMHGGSGLMIESAIFVGSEYYHRLAPLARDRMRVRARGRYDGLTRQPTADSGAATMHYEPLVRHGLSSTFRDGWMRRGEGAPCRLAICQSTGMVAVCHRGRLYSPQVDGPVQFQASVDRLNESMSSYSLHGRAFTVVEVPYALKLLMQELQAMNVQLRLLTEDSLQQWQGLSDYRDAARLMNKDSVRHHHHHIATHASVFTEYLDSVRQSIERQRTTSRGTNGTGTAATAVTPASVKRAVRQLRTTASSSSSAAEEDTATATATNTADSDAAVDPTTTMSPSSVLAPTVVPERPTPFAFPSLPMDVTSMAPANDALVGEIAPMEGTVKLAVMRPDIPMAMQRGGGDGGGDGEKKTISFG